MRFIYEKTGEWLTNIWVKMLFVIPTCFFDLNEKEKIMIFSLLVIMILDCLAGVMKASYVEKNFKWSLLGKKFARKFILFFLFLGASFVLSKAYDFISFWFYFAGMIITFSEFGELARKAQKLGLPISVEVISELNSKINRMIKNYLK